jgi:chaperonin GroES
MVGVLWRIRRRGKITVGLSLFRTDAMKIVPLGASVVIKRLASEETTAGGIVLPDAAKEKPRQGRVLSVGDGRMLPDGKRVKHQVGEGDRVLFGSYAGTEVLIDGEELLVLNEDDILAIVP